jgi:hypothetical protein
MLPENLINYHPKRALPATLFPKRAWANKTILFFLCALCGSAVFYIHRRAAESAEGKTDDAPENQSPLI